MRCVIQVVNHASVTVDGEQIGRIGRGFLILLGVADRKSTRLNSSHP